MKLTARIKRCKSYLTTVILILVVLRLSVLVFSPIGGAMYSARQIICTAAWVGVASFLAHCPLNVNTIYELHDITHMKNVAFWAMIACVARLASSAVYYWPLVSTDILMSAHNIAELAAWALIAIFFGYYWRIRAVQEKALEEEMEEEE